MLIEAVGIGAAILTVCIYLPQTLKAWRLRTDSNAISGLSLISIVASIAEFSLWIVYCLAKDANWGAYPYFVVLPLVFITLAIVVRAKRRVKQEE